MKKISDQAHWEQVKVNNAAMQYCMKEETRIAGPWEFGERPKVNQQKDSVAKAKEARALVNAEIAIKGPLQSMQEGLISYKDFKAVYQTQ